MRLSGDAGRETECSLHTRVMAVVRVVFNRSVEGAFQSTFFQRGVERAVEECLADPHVANGIATHTINLPALAVPVAKYFMSEVERHFFERAGVDRYGNVSNKGFVGHKARTKG